MSISRKIHCLFRGHDLRVSDFDSLGKHRNSVADIEWTVRCHRGGTHLVHMKFGMWS